jgi:diguanylate cyclase (GGDEF)-like protein/PAS domain S-box-containing protein
MPNSPARKARLLPAVSFTLVLLAVILLWVLFPSGGELWRVVVTLVLAAAAAAIITAMPARPTAPDSRARPSVHTPSAGSMSVDGHSLDSIFHATDHVALAVIDNSSSPGRILQFSPAAVDLFGYSRDEAIGMRISDLHLSEDAAQLPDVLRNLRDGGDGFAGRATLVRKDGNLLQARFSIRPVVGPNGSRQLAIHSAIDVGGLERMEEELYRANETLRAIVEAAPLPIFALDIEGRVQLLWNPAAERATGWRAEEIIGRDLPLDDTAPPDQTATLRNLVSGDAGSAGREVAWRQRDGTLTHYSVYSSTLHDARGHIYGTLTIMVDVSQRRRAEEALRKANEQLHRSVAMLEQRGRQERLLSEMSDMLHSCLNPEEAYPVIMKSGEALFEEQAGALFVQSDGDGQLELAAKWGASMDHEPVFPAEECWALRRYRTHLVSETDYSLHCPLASREAGINYGCVPLVALGDTIGVLHQRLPDSESRLIDSPLAASGAQLAETMAERVGLALANIRLRVKLREQAIRDALTGVFNRRYMQETLERELRRCKRRGSSLAVMMLDLDHFKTFNDEHGHDAGDAALVAFGTFLQSRTRGEDVVCRYGGEEFTLILPDITPEAAAARAEQIRSTFSTLPINHLDREVGTLTVSIGVAMFPDNAQAGDALIHAADEALYRAKAEGRNRILMQPVRQLPPQA